MMCLLLLYTWMVPKSLFSSSTLPVPNVTIYNYLAPRYEYLVVSNSTTQNELITFPLQPAFLQFLQYICLNTWHYVEFSTSNSSLIFTLFQCHHRQSVTNPRLLFFPSVIHIGTLPNFPIVTSWDFTPSLNWYSKPKLKPFFLKWSWCLPSALLLSTLLPEWSA